MSKTSPLKFMYAELPLFADLIKYFPSSIALNIEWEKCWSRPIESPNHPSSERFKMKSKSSDFFFKLPE